MKCEKFLLLDVNVDMSKEVKYSTTIQRSRRHANSFYQPHLAFPNCSKEPCNDNLKLSSFRPRNCQLNRTNLIPQNWKLFSTEGLYSSIHTALRKCSFCSIASSFCFCQILIKRQKFLSFTSVTD